jgi:hypothetical protein
MELTNVEWLMSKIKNFSEGCEVSIRMTDGYLITYFYNTEKHTYHRGLRRFVVDAEHDLLIAESDYGLTGQDEIADFINVSNIAMISIIQNSHAEPATL